ncbi:hypothetical protein BTR23_10810 [Alkalihalophilus pseudofirmus]|nr:hypothetical protein BTR23_10810 [Alkalihalophilus pseudofirmus]
MNNSSVFNIIQKLPVASIYEASNKKGALPSSIKPISPQFKLIGRALPVKCPPGDNLWLHRAVYEAEPGDVLVVDADGYEEAGHWGDILAQAAQVKQIAGLVIYGGVRDSLQMVEMEFPVFSKGICIRGTTKNPHGDGSIGIPISIKDVDIKRGDLVVGDADGVVIISQEQEDQVIQKAIEREKKEEEIVKLLLQGDTTLSIYNLN